jgi:von Hippel-Lindau disease tumor supressor
VICVYIDIILIMANNNNGLRSNESITASFVRFINATSRSVDCIWINYNGHRVKYKTLAPNQFFDANTYVSHPWIFRDSATRDKMCVNTNYVFMPSATLTTALTHRKLVKITLPVLSLKDRCFQVVRDNLTNTSHIDELEIPKNLKIDFTQFCQHIN